MHQHPFGQQPGHPEHHPAEEPVQPFLARRPRQAHQLANRRVEQSDRGEVEESLQRHHIEPPHPVGHPFQRRMLGHGGQVEYLARGPIVLQDIAAHVIPVLLEFLPGLRHRPHAHAVHPVPLDVLVEELSLLRLGEATAEPFRGEQRRLEERGVRPVEDLGVQRAVPAALVVDAFDADVIVADLGPGLRRPIAVEHHTAYRIHRSIESLHPLEEEDRVLRDGRSELRMHVLHGPGPRSLQHARPLTEVLPGQRLRTERRGQRVVPSRRCGATDCRRRRSGIGCAGHRARGRRILSHQVISP